MFSFEVGTDFWAIFNNFTGLLQEYNRYITGLKEA